MSSGENNFGHQPPAPFGDDALIRAAQTTLGEATLRQLEKDFALQGMQLSLPQAPPSYSDLLDQISTFLENEGILHSTALARVLYQMDMSEADIRHKIAHTAPELVTRAIADAMVRRCFAKVAMRTSYKKTTGK